MAIKIPGAGGGISQATADATYLALAGGTMTGAITAASAGVIFNGSTLLADAANVLGLRNATTAQEFRVWGTTTLSKYLKIKHDQTNGIIDVVEPTATTGASQAGLGLTLFASDAVASTNTAGAAAGGAVTITAGDAKRLTSGTATGGNITLTPGAGIGGGASGSVVMGGLLKGSATTSDTTGTGYFQDGNGYAIFRAGVSGDFNIDAYNGSAYYSALKIPTGANANISLTPTGTGGVAISSSLQGGGSKALVDNVATGFVKIAVAQGASVGARIRFTVKVIDAGLDQQIEQGEIHIAAINKGGTVTAATPVVQATTALVTAGTLAATTFTVAEVDADTITVSATSDTSLTATSHTITYFVELNAASTVTQL